MLAVLSCLPDPTCLVNDSDDWRPKSWEGRRTVGSMIHTNRLLLSIRCDVPHHILRKGNQHRQTRNIKLTIDQTHGTVLRSHLRFYWDIISNTKGLGRNSSSMDLVALPFSTLPQSCSTLSLSYSLYSLASSSFLLEGFSDRSKRP